MRPDIVTESQCWWVLLHGMVGAVYRRYMEA
jgi:hypothetical protein